MMKRRGVFKTTVSSRGEYTFSAEAIAEIEHKLPAFNHSTYRLALQSHRGSAFLVGSVDCARRHFDRVGPSESRDY